MIRNQNSDNRFIAYDNGTVLDTETNLMWAANDNGSDIDWHNAKSYCKIYNGGGHIDWRMPTQDELAGLYDAGKSRPGACNTSYQIHIVTELIDITCFTPWASDTRGSEAAYFSFGDGARKWCPQSSSAGGRRALPVRSVKKEYKSMQKDEEFIASLKSSVKENRLDIIPDEELHKIFTRARSLASFSNALDIELSAAINTLSEEIKERGLPHKPKEILLREDLKTEKVVIEGKEYANGDKIIIDGKKYTIDDATPEDIQRDVLGKQILESDPIQWFKNVSDFFEGPKIPKNDDDIKYAFIILLCASQTTKSIKELYEEGLKNGKLKLDSSSVLFQWSTIFLESIYFYSHTLNFSREIESNLFDLLANIFFMASSDDEKRRAGKDMANSCLKRKNDYANYKENSGPVYLYGKVIGESAGIRPNILFIELSAHLSLSNLDAHMSFYKAHFIGKEVDFGKLVEKTL